MEILSNVLPVLINKPLSFSLRGIVIGVHSALHLLNALAALERGQISSIWSIEKGVLFRGILGEISIHRTDSLARARVHETVLENGAVIWAPTCFLHVCRAEVVLYIACVEGVRTYTQKVKVLSIGSMCRDNVCYRSRRFRPGGLCGTILRVRSSIDKGGEVAISSLLIWGLSFSC